MSAAGARRGAAAGYGPAGFTLVELIAALAVMALATAIVAPALEGGLRTREIWRDARGFAATLRHLRHEALVSGEIQELIISVDRNAYHAPGVGSRVTLSSSSSFVVVDGGDSLGPEITRVLFFPNGGTSGVDVVVGAREDLLGARYRIRLDPLIGTVEVGDARA
jgi:type II secretion system protein H